MSEYLITHYFIGFDLGRDRDYSAIAVMSLRRENSAPFDQARLLQPTRLVLELGALQRIPLGTEYLEVVQRLRRVVTRLKSAAGWAAPAVQIYVVIDSAGPGQVAIELIRNHHLGIHLVTTLLSAGHEVGRSQSGKVTIPRRDLITNLRFLLETRMIRVHPRLAHIRVLEGEIAAVRPEGGQYHHDDLAIAAGLAAWQAAKVHPELLKGERAA